MMTLVQAFEMIERGETPEQYKKRIARLRRLANERDSLEAALEVLTEPGDVENAEKKRKRLDKVLKIIDELS